MKQKAALLMSALLLLSACSAPHPPVTQSPAPQVTESLSRTPTSTADGIGVTAENYPRINGSTSTLPIVKALYLAMYGTESSGYPETASKTVPSYEKLLDGQVDMIIVPNASAEIVEKAEKAGVELEFHKIAAEALVFITPTEDTAENITAEQVRSIYLDYGIRDWSELGGPERTLVPLCRNADSGSQSQLDNLILGGQNKGQVPSLYVCRCAGWQALVLYEQHQRGLQGYASQPLCGSLCFQPRLCLDQTEW